MPQVQIEGVFMGASIIERVYEGKTTSTLNVDLYQVGTNGNESVKVTSKDLKMFQTISEGYKLGTPFKCLASVNAYKNNAYYNLEQIVK
ncbi:MULTISPECIES: hypothetical protein [Bacillus cereus group]|uniref:hypothetical protein n=1 Tax=Bacillus cereus group TaxID=86661 RepID=UPI000A384587|nr:MULTISPECIES: hypothetical protein [Bacillus cereus group]AZJ24811.1 hypothetical protein CT694_35930 [Bacillus wiedmannii bv. thuringiensis]HDR3313909.1 hypothetical protein [Bacillus thuringiensis]MDA2052266.1 hypothetical protein [Bacillus cereus]OUA57326.1 hypothetical protein BK785_14210 [Bacillus thuringiensis serovar bolivia]OUA81682.1 hypothetical protein BK787_00220 [Bacillus thuringiensis serovar pahangi]